MRGRNRVPDPDDVALKPWPLCLQALMERTVVLGVATQTGGATPAAGALVARYAGLLAAQGRLTTALAYLDMAPGERVLTNAARLHLLCVRDAGVGRAKLTRGRHRSLRWPVAISMKTRG